MRATALWPMDGARHLSVRTALVDLLSRFPNRYGFFLSASWVPQGLLGFAKELWKLILQLWSKGR